MSSRWLCPIVTLLLTVNCSQQEAVSTNESETSLVEKTTTEIYASECDGCHSNPQTRAPSFDSLAKLNPVNIVFALTNGNMRSLAKRLSVSQIYDLSAYIAGEGTTTLPSDASFCENRSVDSGVTYASQWGGDLKNTSFVGEETSSLNSGNTGSLRLDWVFELPNAADARSQPVVMGESIFIATTAGDLFALNRLNGCIKWHFSAPANSLNTGLNDH